MSEQMKIVSFADLLAQGILEIGDGYRAKLDELGGNGPLFLRAGLLTENGFDWAAAERFRADVISKVRLKTGRPGDTMVTTKGNSVGRTAYVPSGAPEFVYSPHLSYWRSIDLAQLTPGYLRYWSRSPEFTAQLGSMAHGTDMAPYLSLADQRSLRISLPRVPIQEAIADILGSLDDKISGNNLIVTTAERLGRAIFTMYFADPLARSMVGQELPSGWDTINLGLVSPVLETGRRPRGGVSSYITGVPSIGAESIISLAVFDFKKVKYVPEDYFVSMRQGVVDDYDILLYKDGGRPGSFEPHVSMFGRGFPFDRMCINEHVYRIRLAHPLSQAYGYFWLTSEPIMREMRSRGTGVAIPGLNSSAVREIPVLRPPLDRLEKFDKVVLPLIDLALNSAAEARTLSQMRDTLLPKLMSGVIQVREAEKVVEDVT